MALAAVLAAPAAQPAARPPRFLLAAVSGGAVSLLQSADGIRFERVPGLAPAPGASPALVRRGATLYLYDAATPDATGLGGTLRRFTLAGGRAVPQPPVRYEVQLASVADAQRAAPGAVVPTAAVDDEGRIVLLYALRFAPGTNACPVAGQACVKLRTATEAEDDGVALAGDPGNRAVLSLPPGQQLGSPTLARADRGWAALLQGPCLRVLTAPDPHGSYRDGGCASPLALASPSAVWDPLLREYRVYGIVDGAVLRAISGRLAQIPAERFRPLAGLPARPSAARVVADAP